MSAVGTRLLVVHVTKEYTSASLGMGSFAIASLGLILRGLSVPVTDVAYLLRADAD